MNIEKQTQIKNKPANKEPLKSQSRTNEINRQIKKDANQKSKHKENTGKPKKNRTEQMLH